MIGPDSFSTLEYDKIIKKLADHSSTAGGRKHCSSLVPLSDLESMVLAVKETDDALRILLSGSAPPVAVTDDITGPIVRARTGSDLSCKELLSIGNFLKGCTRLYKFACKEQADPENAIIKKASGIVLLTELESKISKCIAGEDELYDDASQDLRSLRQRIRDSQIKVKEKLDSIVRTHKDALQEQLVTMRDNRYVVPVKAASRSEIKGIVHDTSASGATIFIEPMAVVEMNNKIRELVSKEKYEIEKILALLSFEVRENADTILYDLEINSYIDFLTAKGILAREMKAQVPHLNNKGIVDMRKARHPLIPGDTVVPVDIRIGEKYRTLVITGPNTGGKTVSLKTCGLLTLMAMSGLMIPAVESSQIAVFKDIYADIGDEQSIEHSLSTFSSHMSKLVGIVGNAGSSSLVLLDELGSGTDPSEGAALAIAVLDHLMSKGCTVMATTHYKELKEYALLTEGVENACCEFNVDTLMPTYKLMIGIPGVSNAFAISSRLGLPEEIIEKAKTLMSCRDADFESIMTKTQNAYKMAEELESEAKRKYEDASRKRTEYDDILKKIEENKKDILLKAREKAKEYVDEAEIEMDILLDEVKESIKKQELDEAKLMIQNARAKVRERKRDIDGDIGGITISSYSKGERPKELVEGERYYSSSLDIHGVLKEINTAKNSCILKSGNKMFSVPMDSLHSALPKRQQRRAASKKVDMGNMKSASISTEIKLLGYTVDEAIAALDKYIDDCVLTGIGTIRIVHGKGSGALRSGISQFLKKDKRISSFRLASFGEGDSGVTIAQL